MRADVKNRKQKPTTTTTHFLWMPKAQGDILAGLEIATCQLRAVGLLGTLPVLMSFFTVTVNPNLYSAAHTTRHTRSMYLLRTTKSQS
jgi:hypothetical protein